MSGKIRVALIGAAGRMGQAVLGVAESEGVEDVARTDLGDKIPLADADVLIDFSHPDASRSICDAAIKSKIPIIIGTTGHSTKQRDEIAAVAKQIAVVFEIGRASCRERREVRAGLRDG